MDWPDPQGLRAQVVLLDPLDQVETRALKAKLDHRVLQEAEVCQELLEQKEI